MEPAVDLETEAEPETKAARRWRLGLAAFLGLAGVMHFVSPRFFDDIVPGWMPGPARTTTYVSGVAELTAAALVANRRTARVGGLVALAVFIGVYPANVQMTMDAGKPETAQEWAVWIRTPLQIPMFLWAWKVSRTARWLR